MSNLEISVVERLGPDQELVILNLDGEVDPNTVTQLRDCLTKLDESGAVNVLLDMKKTTYVNSRALAVLVKFAQTFKKKGGGVSLTNVNARVKMPFDMLGLLVFFQFFDSVEAAKASLI